MTDQLKPCPFCGGDDASDTHTDDCYFGVVEAFKKKAVNNCDMSLAPAVMRAWNRRASISLQPAAAVPVAQEPVAWGAFQLGGKRDGKLYNHADTEAQIDAYILDAHRSNDSLTLRKGPLYTAAPAAEQQGSVKVPRDLLADLCSLDHDTRIQAERRLLALLGKEGEA